MQPEIWKDIEGYEGCYKVSNWGRIKSLGRTYYHSHDKCNVSIKEKILKFNCNEKYYRVGLCKNYVRKHYRVHRLVAETFIPNPERKPEVNHKNGNRFNNYVFNLEWVTPTENMRHAYKNGLKCGLKGEKNSQAKMTEKQVLEIRKIYPKLSQGKLAKKYNVSVSLIKNVLKRRSWKHI
ncbi:MAG: NUMOD4 domain-containing protein [Candidatus Nanoarchaeia archaeon]|nr:NUMOD4 domain-containing protein [Candidatus Nanoarchaeia archaeon]